MIVSASLALLLAAQGPVWLLGEEAPAPVHAGPRLVIAASASNEDAELVDAIRGAGQIVFEGGDLKTWFGRLYPRHGPSRLKLVVAEAHQRGASLVGRGATAALLAQQSVVDGIRELGEIERNPRKLDAPRTAYGMGLAEGALIDTAGRSQARWRRLYEAMQAQRPRLSVYLDARSAARFEAGGDRLLSGGSDPLWIFDLRRERRRRHGPFGARLTRLAEGDTWNRRERRVATAGGSRPAEAGEPIRAIECEDVFDPRLLDQFFAARPLPARWVARDSDFELELEVDRRTQVWARNGAVTSVSDLRLEIRSIEAPSGR
jgi:hypothetical protein